MAGGSSPWWFSGLCYFAVLSSVPVDAFSQTALPLARLQLPAAQSIRRDGFLVPTSLPSTVALSRQSPSRTQTQHFLSTLNCVDVKKNAVIVGAGPAGLLAAHYLLSREDKYNVHIIEKRGDPRQGTAPSLRSYSLGLGVRGRAAIRGAGEDVWQAVKDRGVQSERFCLHLGKRVLDIRQKKSSALISEPSTLLNRADLCAALLEAVSKHPNAKNLNLDFKSECLNVDFATKTLSVGGDGTAEKCLKYDLLIAADGVNSAVRNAVVKEDSTFKYASAPLNGTQKIIHLKMPDSLDPYAVHAMSGSVKTESGKTERVGLFWVPERNRTTGETQACVLVNWDEGSVPDGLLQLKEAESVQQYLNSAFPLLEGGITIDAAQQFLDQRTSVNTVNKCSRYDYAPAGVVIMGDAAHCTGGASGQGCNSALQDAQVLNSILDETNDDLSRAPAMFSELRVPEGHALLDLSINQSPKAPLLRVLFLLFSAAETLGHTLLPSVINPPTQNMLTQTDLKFSEIYAKKKVVNDFIKASNAKYGIFTGY